MTGIELLGLFVYEVYGPIVLYTSAILTAFLIVLVIITVFDEFI